MTEIHFNNNQKIMTNFSNIRFSIDNNNPDNIIGKVRIIIQQGNDIIGFLKANPDNLTISTFEDNVEQYTRIINGKLSDITDVISQIDGTIISRIVINGTLIGQATK